MSRVEKRGMKAREEGRGRGTQVWEFSRNPKQNPSLTLSPPSPTSPPLAAAAAEPAAVAVAEVAVAGGRLKERKEKTKAKSASYFLSLPSSPALFSLVTHKTKKVPARKQPPELPTS